MGSSPLNSLIGRGGIIFSQMRAGSSYSLWFSIFVALGFMAWMASMGATTGLDFGSDTVDVNRSINSSNDAGTFDSAYSFYDTATNISTNYNGVFWLVVFPITALAGYTLVSWFSIGGG